MVSRHNIAALCCLPVTVLYTPQFSDIPATLTQLVLSLFHHSLYYSLAICGSLHEMPKKRFTLDPRLAQPARNFQPTRKG